MNGPIHPVSVPSELKAFEELLVCCPAKAEKSRMVMDFGPYLRKAGL
jgi:hypothetical protein